MKPGVESVQRVRKPGERVFMVAFKGLLLLVSFAAFVALFLSLRIC